MLKEYYQVFRYDKFKEVISDEMAGNVLYCLVKGGIFINDVEQAKKVLLDKDDIPFFEVKESAAEFDPMLVTGNQRHYPPDEYIVTPKELLVILQHLDRFIANDIDYEHKIDEIIKTNTALPKYTAGTELLEEIFIDVNSKSINASYFE